MAPSWSSAGATVGSSGHGVLSAPMSAALDILQTSIIQKNTAETSLASCKILLKILSNAMEDPTSTIDNGSAIVNRRRLRLSNKKIQKNVVKVTGALDLLGLLGFAQDGPDHVILKTTMAEVGTSSEEEALLLLAPSQQDFILSCCVELQRVSEELERGMSKAEGVKKVSSFASQTNTPTTLSEQVYKERLAKIARDKAAKKREKEIFMRIWNETVQERKEAEERKEAAKLRLSPAASAMPRGDRDDDGNIVPLGVTIRNKKEGDGGTSSSLPRLPKPFLPTKEEQEGEKRATMMAAAAKFRTQQQAQKQSDSTSPALKVASVSLSSPKKTPEASSRAAMMAAAAAARAQASTNNADTEMTSSDQSPFATAEAAPVNKAEEECKMTDGEMDIKSAAIGGTDAVMDSKPAAIDSLVKIALADTESEEWKDFVATTSLCAPASGIRETSVYYKQGSGKYNTSASVPSKCLKRLLTELSGLGMDLPSNPNASIWVRFDEETPQYLRVLLAAPLPGPTPYSGGLFTFDVFIPPTYPQDPPKVTLLTTGGGSVRFGPNLYDCGKVCLSLLGTWPGPKWSSKHSTLLQVFISIQGLILGVEHPYYLEPGHGGWEGKVKEGDFQTTGQTLAGATVQQEMGVPIEVVLYEDEIRVGSVKYAMIQTLQAAMNPNKPSNKWARPFASIIEAHFYHNQAAILNEVRFWITDHMLGRTRSAAKPKLPIDKVSAKLLPQLEQLFSETTMPNIVTPMESTATLTHSVNETESIAKPPPPSAAGGFLKAAATSVQSNESSPKVSTKRSGDSGNVLANKRSKMQAAAQSGDFILASKLQEEVRRLEQLEISMKEAASAGDFIRAGNLQAQLEALFVAEAVDENFVDAVIEKDDEDMMNAEESDIDSDEEMEQLEGGEYFSDEDGLDGGDDGMTPSNIHGLGKNVFAPAGWNGGEMKTPRNYNWGGGSKLGQTTGSRPVAATKPETIKPTAIIDERKEEPKKKQYIPRDQLCRLRIRLPNDSSVVEDFNMTEPLSVVYSYLRPIVDVQSGSSSQARAHVPTSVSQGAFSKPISSAGFTLLLTRPKREFNLEMHGAKTLESLNLAPSATLTIMKSKDRGVMHRGELESRLQDAEGDAMDVDGLTYEGLVELTERVGGAAPSNGSAFVSLTVEELEDNSESFSSSEYLSKLGNSAAEDERRCPICLGEYDESDENITIRKLKRCGHHFHTGCLETWLTTKSSCPLCKCSIRSDE